ncbi:MAG: rhodanese-like domain-containing protein, partial [Acidimicrobiia bacterium]|nr:rhodanese-like domain-containing protein [Acidimicrobiia bacterium]
MTNEKKRARIEEVYARSKRLFASVPELTVDELDRLAASTDVVLVDVRAAKEQAISMIPGAVTAREFESSSSLYSGRTVVAYCTVGHRSGLYAKKLLDRGWQAFNLKGAILAWTHADRDLEIEGVATRRVHV